MSDDDITRNYHKGNPQSVEANKRTDKERDAARIYAYVFSLGMYGATSDEVDVALWGGVAHQTASARFSEMKRDGDLVPIGTFRKTRKNCNAEVHVAAAIWEQYLKTIMPTPPAPLPPAEAQPDLFA